MTTVTRTIRFETKGRRKRATKVATDGDGNATASKGDAVGRGGTAVTATPNGRVPRIARLMALAIKFDGLLCDGTVKSISELAQLARVTQPRMTQIMNLLHLASDIQEALLGLPHVTQGRDAITERDLRLIASERLWSCQRDRAATILYL